MLPSPEDVSCLNLDGTLPHSRIGHNLQVFWDSYCLMSRKAIAQLWPNTPIVPFLREALQTIILKQVSSAWHMHSTRGCCWKPPKRFNWSRMRQHGHVTLLLHEWIGWQLVSKCDSSCLLLPVAEDPTIQGTISPNICPTTSVQQAWQVLGSFD